MNRNRSREMGAAKRSWRLLGGLLCPLLLTACGSSPAFEKSLDEMWQWDGGVEASHVISALKNKKTPETVPAAVGVTARGLVGRALPDGKLWTHEGEVDVLPTLVGDMVLFTDRGDLIALDVRTGSRRFTIPVNQRRLEGAGYDGTHTILLLVDKDDAREDQVRVVGPRGEDLYSATATARMGTPAAVDGIGLLPYNGQYVGAFDLKTHEPIGRILVRDAVHTVSAEGQRIVIYGKGATLLDENLTSSPESHSLKLDARKFPGEPVWPVDGSAPRPARGQPVSLYAEPISSEGNLKFSNGAYVATYFEIVVGLDHGSNEIRWVNHFPRSIAGGASGRHGPTLCLENGSVWRVSLEDGTSSPFGTLGAKVKACVVTGSSDKIPSSGRPSVLAQMEATIEGTGPDMIAMQRVLLEELGENKSEETTKALLGIAQNPLVSADLSRRAGRLLSSRKSGGELMVAALVRAAPVRAPEQPIDPNKPVDPSKPTDPKADPNKPADPIKPADPNKPDEGAWEEGQENDPDPAPGPGASIDPNAQKREAERPPPVGALARALFRLKTPGAASALAPYLDDPALSAADTLSIMRTIGALGDPSQIPDVESFLNHYKNTGGEAALLDALVLAAKFLFKHMDDPGKERLQKSLDQSLTHPDLRARLEKLRVAKPAKKQEVPPKDP